MGERVNLRVAIPFTVAGIGLCVGGLALGTFDSASWSSLFLNAGTAVGLLAVFVAVEPRLRRRVAEVAERAATTAVDSSTSELRERVVKLENLDAEQAVERDGRVQARAAGIERLRTEPLSPSAVGELLASADDERLFDGGEFRVRTNAGADAHVLYMLPVRAANGVRVMWLDFERFEFSGEVDSLTGIPFPQKGDATTIWINEEPASHIASALEAGLERRNEPLNGFSFAYGLERLADSVRIMREARSAGAGDGNRLHGLLRLMINDRWLLTSYGLESVMTPAAFPIEEAGFRGGGRASVLWPGCIHGCERPTDEPEREWQEAIRWLESRERLKVLRPGEAQAHPAAVLRRQP